ncbi:hypothetical protein [Nocardioides abyssi]|uniref:Glycosyltransferase RgtA/B/C/D-like domain-containing protein n=1 Tax=Nocardioides abyssi TaxID=3058370 RepID=A0ABT8ERF6_9ACTN|nr:hypothetical protein [Nocardioides abyssi]MDN4160714.1 hypothetical protein [Nocardioides abyssi]
MESRSTRLVRVVMPAVLFGAVLAALVHGAARAINNPDTYFHLRFGHEFADGWSLTDPGSVSSFATAEWVPTQWLPQVLMASLENGWGLAGVAFLGGVQAIVLATVVYVATRQRADALVAATVTIVVIVTSWQFLSVRPQVLSYAFAAAAVGLWAHAHRAGTAPWLVLPLTWLWAMWHGMWPVALSIGLVGVAAAALERRGWTSIARQAAVVLGCVIAGAVTPVGPKLYRAVLGVGERAPFFSEWGPTDFISVPGIGVLVLLAPAFLVLLRSTHENGWLDILTLGLAAGWALYSARTVPVAAAIAAPVVAATLQRGIGPRAPWKRFEAAALLATTAAAVLGLGALASVRADEAPSQPGWVDRELRGLPAGTPLLNHWNTGGYVMWRYPDLDLVMHGYGDTFTIAELERNRDLLEVQPGWDDLARETGARHALLPPDSPLAYALVHQTGWTVKHTSEHVEFLVAPPDWPAE